VKREPKKHESEKASSSAPEPYEPPKLSKFEKLEKLIVSGE
jgi:hypothetical protein